MLSHDLSPLHRSRPIDTALARALRGGELTDDETLALAEAPRELTAALCEAARVRRDRAWGRRTTYSPKVFLPITNLCRNRCDYCAFRRSAGDPGAWTMTPDQVIDTLKRARQRGAFEALLCLGDKPEAALNDYRRLLASFGHGSTVDYLVWASERAVEQGLLPHTNAGVLTREEMRRLRRFNVSLGLMLESVSERLCRRGGPHYRAPDKRPTRRLRMLREAGELRIPLTTGILVGIGETRRERIETLLAIRTAHRTYGHVQEVIVQNFTPHPNTPMSDAVAPTADELEETIACARLVLDVEVSVQSPPNLNATRISALLAAGINDFGGISPVTCDYINRDQPWPELVALGAACQKNGFVLEPRLAIYSGFAERAGFVDPLLLEPIRRAAAELRRGVS